MNVQGGICLIQYIHDSTYFVNDCVGFDDDVYWYEVLPREQQ